MKDAIVDGLQSLTPPDESAPPKDLVRWRWRMAIVTSATALSLGAYIAIASGFVSSMFPGYASAGDVDQLKHEVALQVQTVRDEVQSVRDELRQSRLSGIEASILDTRAKQCTAPQQVKQLYTVSMQRLVVEYQNLTGKTYPLPECSDFR